MHRNSNRTMRRPNRSGAVFSVEMMMVISVLIPMMFALTEFSLLWSARHTLEAASFAAARAAAMANVDDQSRRDAADAAARSVLVKQRFKDNFFFDTPDNTSNTLDVGTMTGNEITVKLKLPMTSAAPDLLAIIGISITDKFLIAETVTCRE